MSGGKFSIPTAPILVLHVVGALIVTDKTPHTIEQSAAPTFNSI
jgi:hypothetical protein